MRRSYLVPIRWMVIYEYEVTGRALNLNSTKLTRPWSPWGFSPSRKHPHGRTGNITRDLMISSQKLWPLDHEAGPSSILFPESLMLCSSSVLGDSIILPRAADILRRKNSKQLDNKELYLIRTSVTWNSRDNGLEITERGGNSAHYILHNVIHIRKLKFKSVRGEGTLALMK
jgi:hypothetical protein